MSIQKISVGNTPDNAESVSTTLDVVIDILEEVRKLVSPGGAKTINIRYKGKVVAALPVALTVAGTIAVGVAAAIVSRLVVDIEREG